MTTESGAPPPAGVPPSADAARTREPTATTLGVELVAQGRVFTLTREQVRLPDGRRTRLDVVRHPGAAAILPLRGEESGEPRVVLLWQYRHAIGRWILEVPAGTLAPGEDPRACAERELEEETGWRADELVLLSTIWPAPGYTDERIALYLARGLRPGRQALDGDEALEVREHPLAEALAWVESGRIADAKSVAALLLGAAWLRGGGRR